MVPRAARANHALARRVIAPNLSCLLLGREHFHRERELPLLAGRDRTHADDLSSHFLAAIVGDRDHHGVLPRLAFLRMTDRSLDTKRREGGDDHVPRLLSGKAHVLLT